MVRNGPSAGPRSQVRGPTCHNGGVEQRRWLDPSQPQTLQSATILSYLYAAFGILGLLIGGSSLYVLAEIAAGVGGYGIANDKKWGFVTSLVAALVVLLWTLLLLVVAFGLYTLINTAFSIVLVALLLHPQSREYRRIWFR